MFILKVLFALLGNLVIFGELLFLPVWTLNWERAWVFLGVVAVSVIATMIIAFRENEELWNERLKAPIQQGQPLIDKIIVSLFALTFFGLVSAIRGKSSEDTVGEFVREKSYAIWGFNSINRE